MVVQGYRANIQETEREDLKIQVHPVIYNEALSVNKPTNKIPMACLHYPDSTNTIKADGWLSNYTHINDWIGNNNSLFWEIFIVPFFPLREQ